MKRTFINIIQIWMTETREIMHDKGILIFIIFVPLCYPLLYSFVYTNEVVRDVPFAVIDDCNSTKSREFIRKMDATPDAQLVAHCNDVSEARQLLKESKVYGILRIPKTFSRDIWRGEQTTVGLYCSMSSLLYYKALLLAANNVSLDMNRDIKVEKYLHPSTREDEEISRMPIEYDYISLYNPQSGFAAFLIPPVLMLIIQQTLFLGIGMSMGNQREKCLAHMLPKRKWYRRPFDIVTGKAIFYFVIYLIMAIYMYTAVTRWFGLPNLGDYWVFLRFVIPYILACIFMAMVLSVLVYRREDCIMLFVFLSVPLLFMSGISWPGSEIPQFWKCGSWLFPSTFGMNGYLRIMGTGASIADVRNEYIGLWCQVLVYATLACLMYRLRLKTIIKRLSSADTRKNISDGEGMN